MRRRRAQREPRRIVDKNNLVLIVQKHTYTYNICSALLLAQGCCALQACRSRLLIGSMICLHGLRNPTTSMTFGHTRRSQNFATSLCRVLRSGFLPTRRLNTKGSECPSNTAYQRLGKCHGRPCHGTVQKHRFEVDPWHNHELFDGAMSSHISNN